MTARRRLSAARTRSATLTGSVQELLSRTQTPEKAKELAALLATGTWTHDYPITMEEGRKRRRAAPKPSDP